MAVIGMPRDTKAREIPCVKACPGSLRGVGSSEIDRFVLGLDDDCTTLTLRVFPTVAAFTVDEDEVFHCAVLARE